MEEQNEHEHVPWRKYNVVLTRQPLAGLRHFSVTIGGPIANRKKGHSKLSGLLSGGQSLSESPRTVWSQK